MYFLFFFTNVSYKLASLKFLPDVWNFIQTLGSVVSYLYLWFLHKVHKADLK